MLSTLPKLADKAFIVGFFIPCLLFVIAVLALFSDVPKIQDFLVLTEDSKTLDKLVYLVLAVWTLAVFMTIVNTIQYKMLEGYRGPLSSLEFLRRREIQRFHRIDNRVHDLQEKRYAAGGKLPEDEEIDLRKKWVELRRDFPDQLELLLPTRFGNAIRAFEHYSRDVYGADSVALWYHLSSVIPKDFQAFLAEARAQVDCLVNIVFFAIILGLCAAVRLLAAFVTWTLGSSTVPHLGIHLVASNLFVCAALAVVTPLVALSAYKLSLERVYIWGDWVKFLRLLSPRSREAPRIGFARETRGTNRTMEVRFAPSVFA
jgi:hypothetical protein